MPVLGELRRAWVAEQTGDRDTDEGFERGSLRGRWPACSAAFRQPTGSSASASRRGTQPGDAEQDFPQTDQVEIGQHIAAAERDGGLLADAAQAAGLAASVPACPGWQVRGLVRHQAYVHAWAARHVAEQAAEIIGTPG
jgi:hypothetical protein